MTSIRSSAAYPIAVAYAAIFAWVLLLLGAGVYWVANAEFVRQQDREITEELHRLAREGNRTELLRELGWRKAQRPTYRFGYALFDRHGKRVDGTLEIARPGLGLGDLTQTANAENGQLTRAGAIDLADGSRLVVAAKSESIDRIKHTILRLFLLAVVIILLISAIGALVLGYYLNWRLTPINATANAIITGHMDLSVESVAALIGGLPARVDFAGLAPGFVGLYQVNAVVPAGIPSGDDRADRTRGGTRWADNPRKHRLCHHYHRTVRRRRRRPHVLQRAHRQ